MERGFVKLWRKTRDSAVRTDPTASHVWHMLLIDAGIRAKNYRGTYLKPGQLVIGRTAYAADIGLNPSTLYKALKRLEEWGQIALSGNSRGTTVTICNWEVYQSSANVPVTAEEQPGNSPVTAEEQPGNTKREGENKRIREGEKEKARPRDESAVREFFEDIGHANPPAAAAAYWNHYQANGWKVGRNAMKDWKSAARNWKKRDEQGHGNNGSRPNLDESNERERQAFLARFNT